MKQKQLVEALTEAIVKACADNGFSFGGINVHEDNGSLRFRFTARSTDESPIVLADELSKIGVPPKYADEIFLNSIDQRKYRVTRINYDNAKLPIVVTDVSSHEEFLVSIEHFMSVIKETT